MQPPQNEGLIVTRLEMGPQSAQRTFIILHAQSRETQLHTKLITTNPTLARLFAQWFGHLSAHEKQSILETIQKITSRDLGQPG